MRLLEHLLLPLHATNAFLNETVPLLELYHEQLVFCLLLFIQKRGDLLGDIIRAIVTEWPSGHSSNSPKVRVPS